MIICELTRPTNIWYLFFGTVLIFTATCCQAPKPDYNKRLYYELDIQGHRGCRGFLPENSIVGFIQALEWGITTLEMDVVISMDHQVVLSHEPFMSHYICVDSSGAELDSASHFQYNIYKMTYEEIRQFDCGSKAPDDFKDQKPHPGPKPLLKDGI